MLIRIALTAATLVSMSFTSIAAHAQAPGIRQSPNGFHRANDNIPVLSTSEISSEKADQLFKAFAANRNIPFAYADGSAFRASEMTAMAEAQGVQMSKVFIEGQLSTKLLSSQYPYVRVAWNTAPVAYVIGGPPDFKSELKVFDPSVATRPISLEEWRALNVVADPSRNDTYEPLAESDYLGSRFQMKPRSVSDTVTGGSPDEADLRPQVFARYNQFLAHPELIPAVLKPDARRVTTPARPTGAAQ